MLYGTVIRAPAVAGLFYPQDRQALIEMVRGFLDAPALVHPGPKALIAPHAGYIYSGPIAGTAFAQLQLVRDTVRRVVLFGPSHYVGFPGMALPSASHFVTPLGRVAVDAEAVATLLDLPSVNVLDAAHAQEHSLETHLPFLQAALGDFTLVPVVTGDVQPADVEAAFNAIWGGPETLLVVSSDLSHELPYDEARRVDAATSRAIEALDDAAIGARDACGRVAIQGLLRAARARGLKARCLDQRNSGDTAGTHQRVVGYGAYALYER